jgi:hypothetical protein
MARSNAARQIVFPVSRMVMGSFYIASDKDADGKPRIVKTGQNAGQPTQQFFFAFAVPKTPGIQHWAHESWGAEIWAVGNTCFPKIAENPSFAWKIVDGDSAVPNKKGIAPNTREGYPGNWVVSCSSTYAPKLRNTDNSAYILEKDAVMPGDFIQIAATVDGNASTQNPGVYINHDFVRFVGYSADGRIHTGADPDAVQWSAAPTPASIASKIVATPAGGATVTAPVSLAPALPGATVTVPVSLAPALPGAPVTVPAPAAAPLALVPSPGFLAPPAAAAPLPPPKAARTMTAKAQGNTYEGLIAQGWTEALLLQHGLMVA